MPTAPPDFKPPAHTNVAIAALLQALPTIDAWARLEDIAFDVGGGRLASVLGGLEILEREGWIVFLDKGTRLSRLTLTGEGRQHLGWWWDPSPVVVQTDRVSVPTGTLHVAEYALRSAGVGLLPVERLLGDEPPEIKEVIAASVKDEPPSAVDTSLSPWASVALHVEIEVGQRPEIAGPGELVATLEARAPVPPRFPDDGWVTLAESTLWPDTTHIRFTVRRSKAPPSRPEQPPTDPVPPSEAAETSSDVLRRASPDLIRHVVRGMVADAQELDADRLDAALALFPVGRGYEYGALEHLQALAKIIRDEAAKARG